AFGTRTAAACRAAATIAAILPDAASERYARRRPHSPPDPCRTDRLRRRRPHRPCVRFINAVM
ncbi:hypothetical protein ACW4FQ_33405, partial [Escherichia coli]